MKTRLLLLTSLLCGAGLAHAAPITYSISATATGSLGGVSFTNQLVTLTMNGDTSNVTGGPSFFSNTGTGLFSVAGTGSGTFTNSVIVFVNQTFSPPAAGFADPSTGSILDTVDSAFATYALVTAIGPITNANFINPGQSFPTTAGEFIIRSAGPATFTATLGSGVPEPMSVSLIGVGLAAIMGARLRRRRD